MYFVLINISRLPKEFVIESLSKAAFSYFISKAMTKCLGNICFGSWFLREFMTTWLESLKRWEHMVEKSRLCYSSQERRREGEKKEGGRERGMYPKHIHTQGAGDPNIFPGISLVT